MNTKELVTLITKTLDDNKAIDITEIDVTNLTDVTDTMIVCSGSSSRHVNALGDRLREALREHGHKPLSVQGEDTNEWILIDAADAVVHIMLPATREFYDIERLWSITSERRQSSED